MLFITHDMGVVAEIADRVAVMRQGRLVETGALDTILRQPAMEYTRNLLCSVPSLVPRAPRADSNEPVVLEANDLGNAIQAIGKELAAEQGDDDVTLSVEVQGAPDALHPIVRDETSLVHANGFHMQVVIEPIAEALARIAAAGSPVTLR